MSDRERWIVYPLIFFAFLLGARDKYFKPERAEYESISCRRLTVTSLDGTPLVQLSGTIDDSGVIVMYAPVERGLEPPPRTGFSRDTSPPGRHAIELVADSDGGYLKVFGPAHVPALKLGHEKMHHVSGLLAVDDHDNPLAADQDAARELWGINLAWAGESDANGGRSTGEAEASAGSEDSPPNHIPPGEQPAVEGSR
jgi:hypothetical protein